MSSNQSSLSRRSYLALAGAGLSGLAGCLGGAPATAEGSSAAATDAADTQRPTEVAASTSAVGPTPQSQARSTPTRTPAPPGTAAVATAEPSAIEQMEAQLTEISLEGSYFDTHAHWQNNSVVSAYPSFMEQYGIGATVLFSPSQTAKTDYRSFLEQLTAPDAQYLPFMAAPPPGHRFSAAAFKDLYDGKEAAFVGIGEWKNRRNTPGFTEEPLASIFELAGRLDIPMMYHPFSSQEGTIEDGLSTFSETTFLLHGFQMTMMGKRTRTGSGDLLPRLLREYENLYWTADVATMLGGKLFESQSVSEFIEWYDSDQSQEGVDRYRTILPVLLDAAPNRVMWGTDVAFDWHMDDAVMSRVMDATERILEGVPEEHHEPYKYQNAVEMFGL